MSSTPEITPALLRRMLLPDPKDGDKEARGNVLVVAGGTLVPGAALLAGQAALRAGAGRLQVATCARNATSLGLSIPEALVIGMPETVNGAIDPRRAEQLWAFAEKADAILIGPGLEDEKAIGDLVLAVLEKVAAPGKFVFDARAIKSLRTAQSVLARQKNEIVITPHAGEMAGLMGVERSHVEADPARIAQQAAKDFRAVIALKGARTVVVSPQGERAVCREGNVGLATSGSGDVLAGTIAGLMARGAPAFAATCWGVYLHARAGDRLAKRIGPLGFLARELLLEIPAIMGELRRKQRAAKTK